MYQVKTDYRSMHSLCTACTNNIHPLHVDKLCTTNIHDILTQSTANKIYKIAFQQSTMSVSTFIRRLGTTTIGRWKDELQWPRYVRTSAPHQNRISEHEQFTSPIKCEIHSLR